MTIGDGIFGAAVVISLVALFIATKDRWNWKKIFLYPLLLLVVAGLGFWGWTIYNERPKIETELWDIKLGDTMRDVRFKKGEPRRIPDNKDDPFAYSGEDDALILVMVSEERVTSVVAIRSKDKYSHILSILGLSGLSIQGVYFGVSVERIVEQFGQPSETRESKDGLRRIYAYPRYQLIFGFGQNKLDAMGVYNPAHKIPIGFGGE